MDIDNSNEDFFYAVEFVNRTNKSVFLTGKAGTGKTTFLRYIRENTSKQMVILAPTGVAAINAGGATLNSFFQLPFSPFVPGDSRLRTKASEENPKETIYNTFKFGKEKLEILQNLELIIIDEVSMVRCDTLDVIDRILKVFRKKSHLPFGGVQIVLIGDARQLPPVVKKNEDEILSQFYESSYFFSAKAFVELDPIHIELKKIYRQKDIFFIDILNKIRENKMSLADFESLNSKFNTKFENYDKGYITLSTKRVRVDLINKNHLDQLDGDLFTFYSKTEGDFPEGSRPTDHELQLKEGAQVMFVKNDPSEIKAYHNGKIGKVKNLNDDVIVVEDDNGSEINVSKVKWDNISYTYNKETKRMEEVLLGSFTQFPVKLAWAVTVHKSQGLTFNKVVVDVGDAFLPGQVYVALSRCTSFSGIILKTKITPLSIISDINIEQFSKSITPNDTLQKELINGKANQYYNNAIRAFKRRNFDLAFEEFRHGMKLSNELDKENSKRLFVIEMKRLAYSSNGKFQIQVTSEEKKYSDVSDLIELYLIAKDLSDKGKNSEAIEVYSKIIQLDGDQLKALKSRAKLYYENFNFLKSVEDYNRIIKIDPNDPEVYHEKANSLFQIGGREIESIEFYNKAISIDPYNFRAYNNRGRTLIALKRIDEAMKDFDFVIGMTTSQISTSSEKERLYYLRGWAKMKKEEFDKAIDDFNKALEIDPTYRSALESRKDCKKSIEEHHGVIEDCNKLIQIDKYKEHKYIFDRALSKNKINDNHGAIEDYTILIKKEMEINNITVRTCLSYNNRGVCKEKLNDLEGALKDYEYALRMKLDDELYQRNLKRVKKKLFVSEIDDLPF